METKSKRIQFDVYSNFKVKFLFGEEDSRDFYKFEKLAIQSEFEFEFEGLCITVYATARIWRF